MLLRLVYYICKINVQKKYTYDKKAKRPNATVFSPLAKNEWNYICKEDEWRSITNSTWDLKLTGMSRLVKDECNLGKHLGSKMSSQHRIVWLFNLWQCDDQWKQFASSNFLIKSYDDVCSMNTVTYLQNLNYTSQ